MAETKTNKGYLTGREIRAITRENNKITRKLEAYKNRKADESEFLSEMKNPENILEMKIRASWMESARKRTKPRVTVKRV